MRRRSALLASLAGLLASGPALAEDPRDLFGLGPKPAAEPPPSCDDGTAFGCATALDPFDEASPYALRTQLTGSYLLRLPVGDVRHDAVAHFALGVSRDDAGPSFAGATGLENVWTVEGAPVESLRTGNVETRIPLAFLDSLIVTAGGFAARDRNATGGTIEARLLRGGERHEASARAWGTLYAQADRTRPIPRATYQLRRISFRPLHELSAAVTGTGPLPRLLGGKAWYAGGVAPNLGYTDVRWRAATLVDRDRDGIPDGLPGVVEVQRITDETERTLDYAVPLMARAGWERGRHELEVTLLGSAAAESVYFANATRQAAGVRRRFLVGDAIASWRGTWRDTRARARLSWHRSDRRDAANDPAAADLPQLQSAYVPTDLPEEPGLARTCDVSTDPDATIPKCPVPFGFFISGGAGQLLDSVGDRPVATADVAHRIGAHVLRAGGVFDDARLVNRARFTGGRIDRSLFPGHLDTQRFFRGSCPEDPAAPCNYIPESEIIYRTRYTSAYLEDTFHLAPNIRANGGLRWELLWAGPYLHQSKQFAPRLGLAWDVIGDGSSRLFASMGRSFVLLPAGIGPTIIGRPPSVRDVRIGALGESRNTDPGGIFPPAAGIEPAAQDEATVGFEIGRVRTARAAVWLQARSLRRGYDTVLADPETFELSFDNPGRHPGETPARRDTTLVAVEVSTDPAAKTVVRATYLHGRTTGSWTGPVDPRQGQVLYAGSDWDVESANYLGLLPTDAGHRVAVEGERRGRVGSVELGLAARLTVASGRPRNVLGDTDIGIVYLLPRGSAGRAPAVSQANLRGSARWRGLDVTLDVFNVFDRQTATNFDEIYAGGVVRPIAGGTEADLVFLKQEGGDPLVRRNAFRLPSAFQAPIAATLGIHYAF
ncbi:MAG TPA: TonB-dependent receptor [Kofleriaceae bacterium]|nr:TonB-dependent receptor [Kofleriaceae bacterium]